MLQQKKVKLSNYYSDVLKASYHSNRKIGMKPDSSIVKAERLL